MGFAGIILVALAAVAPQVEVRAHDGRSLTGTLLELNATQATIDQQGRQTEFNTRDLAAILTKGADRDPAVRLTTWVELIDGTLLPVTSCEIKDGIASLRLPQGGQVEFPGRLIASLRFREQSQEVQNQWKRLLEAEHPSDLVVLRKGDRLDYLEGVLHGLDPAAVFFEFENRLVKISRDKVEGLIYHRPQEPELAATVAEIDDAYGATYQVGRLELQNDRIDLTTATDLHLRLPLSLIREIRFGSVLYLSDLKPERVEWRPYISSTEPLQSLVALYEPRLDRALAVASTPETAAPLLLRWTDEHGNRRTQSYARGIALHSRSEAVFRLPRDARWLHATAGIDARLGDRGDVRLVILGDDKKLFDQTITGRDNPATIQVDVSGVRRLNVVVDYGDDSDLGDFLNLCDAKILK